MEETSRLHTCSNGDAIVLEGTLEAVTSLDRDISPAVYSRFLSRCPAKAELFRMIDAEQPPHGCGQMLFEIISLLQDNATNKQYVAGYMRQIADEHAAFGVTDTSLYAEFLASLVDVLAAVLGSDWTDAHAAAWTRQSEALLRHLPSGPIGRAATTSG